MYYSMNELLSQDSLTSKRNFKVGKDVLNLHENLTVLSNRRLTHQSLSFFNLNWSIDRITIVGFLKKFDFDHTTITEDGEIIFLKKRNCMSWQMNFWGDFTKKTALSNYTILMMLSIRGERKLSFFVCNAKRRQSHAFVRPGAKKERRPKPFR